MALATHAQAQCTSSTCTPVPANFGNVGSPPVAGIGGAGDETANSFASVNSAAGTIYLYPFPGSNYLSIQAPSAMPNTITWTLPAGTPPANSLLLFPGGTANQLAYANFATTGNVTATYSAGLITLALTGSPSFTGATTFSVGASPVLQLASGGGQSAVAITSAGSGGSPSLAVTGRLEFERPNCVVALSQTTASTDYLEAMASPSGTGATPNC